MQEIPLHLDFNALLIFLGLFLGFFVSYFLIKKSWKSNLPNLFMGLFILSISLTMLEGWLDYTGYIFEVLWLSNFSEPISFLIGGLLYLFIDTQIEPDIKKKYWLHFIPSIVWLGICMFYFLQPDVVKYNDTIEVMQLNIPRANETPPFSDDPFRIRKHTSLLIGIYFTFYILIIGRKILLKANSIGESIFTTTNKTLKIVRNISYHVIVIIIIFILVKIFFKNDVGDYFIHLYASFLIFITAMNIMNQSIYYNEVSTFLELPSLKYKKSSLANEDKEIILSAINIQMQDEKYFLNSTASLSGLSKAIKESSHHVSQVINEKLNQSFFEMLAAYRVEEAKAILKTDLGKKLTIEEVAERVGYNSKSAFNTAFKKFASQTPSAYRDS